MIPERSDKLFRSAGTLQRIAYSVPGCRKVNALALGLLVLIFVECAFGARALAKGRDGVGHIGAPFPAQCGNGGAVMGTSGQGVAELGLA